MTVLEILVIVWISLQLIAGVVSFILVVVFDKKDQKRENLGSAFGSPDAGEEPESTMLPFLYIDCRMKTDTYMEFRKWLRSNHPDLRVVGVPHYEESESSEDFECYCDCCYQHDHVCMNPEGICGDRKQK